ncbi:MAG: chemotaxis protein CheA [Caulobacteraceae bacterium]|nr:MAG: chemotaxis protein CheA [Caulobacteraceae bacterium]
MDELEEIKVTFFQECDELLGDLEAGLLTLQDGAGDAETVNSVFRAVHSVKGGAGAFGLDALVRYAHVFETLMDAVRAGRMAAGLELVRVLLRAADVLADQVTAARGGGSPDEAATAAMVAELESWIAGEPSAGADTSEPTPTDTAEPNDDMDFGFTPMTIQMISLEPEPVAAPPKVWTVTFKPSPSLYAKANEAGLLLRELARLGPVEPHLDDSAIPNLDVLDPEGAYLTWTLRLTTSEDEQAIREAFEFVDGDCDLSVSVDAVEPASPGDAAGDLDIARLIALATAEPESAAAIPLPLPAAASEPAVATAAVAPIAPATPQRQATAAAEQAPVQATIRVDPERIDRLIDLVGELVINQAMLAQRVSAHGFAPSSDVSMGLDELEQLTRGIQDSVMAIRAQPVKSVFQRMPRLLREVATQTRKQARLVMEGEGTEVDKTVIERLAEPITHMLRNAIDHGLESPEDRIAAGKPAEGTVRLAALHRGGRIVIEVQDDGKGINRPRVRQIAIDKGLLAADAQLTDEETDNLIFLPGFSTAGVVSDISGRGVGMDVVRRSVQALGGRISIASIPGSGSTFTLSLPLTLAVLDGMVVDVAGQTLVIPLTAIIESLRPRQDEVHALGSQGAVLAVRDTFVRLVDIGTVLGFRDQATAPNEGVVLLVEGEDGSRSALVADAIQGQRQVVIKSLEANYRQVEGIAAATILGDGRVALIVDVDALVAVRREPARPVEPLLIAAE